ncbi:HD domain-containing phosphohydrolase [Paenibacillus sp. SGZ-1009]|uniref:HD domain-containing phosphohydrolase n=1 Tax=Paenibacillus campi TaxID=3106031 RepID=UPI002AFF8D40|nr:HD domain-containing phosphohydrolase [Paenibacillus sp. SGZ-1009]
MNEKNIYTIPLGIIGLASLVYMFAHLSSMIWIALPMLLFIIVLDLFPVRLLSGEEYSASVAGFLILLLGYGLIYALIGVTLSNVVTHLRKAGFRWRQIHGFRVLSTQGKYTICLLAASVAMEQMKGIVSLPLSLYVQAAVGALLFSGLYMVLAVIVSRSIGHVRLLGSLPTRLKELAVPVLLCTVIVPHFLKYLALGYMAYETLYTMLFLLLIIFFSHGYIEQVRLRRQGMEEFIRLGELRIANREGHGRNVGIICEHVLELFNYPKKRRAELINIAALHDIGKMLLPLEVLTKRGALSLSEQHEYESHTLKGAQIVGNITGDRHAAAWIKHHHERFDGKGFPDRLKGNLIPYESRIICLCNLLEYLIRQYSQNEEVMDQLQRMSGKQLDPQLVWRIHAGTIAWLRQYVIHDEPLVATDLASVVHHDHDKSVQQLASITGGTKLLKYGADGRLHGAGLPDVPVGIVSDAEVLAERALLVAESFYEVLASEGKTYEAYFYPESDRINVVLTDITPALQYREDLHYNTLRSYREVIRTLSHSKIDICLQPQEIERELGMRLDGMEVCTRGDVSSSRNLVMEHVPEWYRQQYPKKLMSIKLAVSEGVTNLIKHAEQGKIGVYQQSNRLQVYITDHGSGIPLHELPKTILVSGYSSKSSLGKGFAVMYMSADRIMLHTSSDGTAILLEFMMVAEETG